MQNAIWDVASRDERLESRLAQALGLHPIIAGLLIARGVTSPDPARRFLCASLDALHDPFDLPDMEPAVARIGKAIDASQRILIHGDYDADGVTATALLTRLLRKMGASVDCFVPHRVSDGYGVSEAAIERAAGRDVSLVITVDCGVSARQTLQRARELGMDAIVIDHHEVPSDPPDVPLIDPKRPDSSYPFPDLASVGLVYKTGLALCQARGLPEGSFQRAFLDLVAVGTIADVAPLVDENRALVREGLALLPQTRKVGLRALLQLCRVDGVPEASDIAFRVAPRINAAGRMADAGLALELMLTADPDEAHRTSLRLDTLNRDRQREQERMVRDALLLAEEQADLDSDLVLLLHSPEWHVGIVGIVAAKLVELFSRPTVLLVEEGDAARGSARSTEGLHIADAFESCRDLLLRQGGHGLAAGLAVQTEHIDALRERLNEYAADHLSLGDMRPRVHVDRDVALSDVTLDLVHALDVLRPFGEGNPPPTLAAYGLTVVDSRGVGREKQHLKLLVEQAGHRMGAIGFGLARDDPPPVAGTRIDACFTPAIDTFAGSNSVQLRLEAIRPA